MSSTLSGAPSRLGGEPISRPSLRLLGAEPLRAALEYASYQTKVRRQAAISPVGDSHPVIIFPGLATNGSAVAPLRKFCASLGYAALDWGRGYNTGPRGNLTQWLDQLADHTAALLAPHQASASLIGWSLGGLYAREVAKRLSSQTRQVITIGTPFNATADHTRVGWLYRLLSGAAVDIAPAFSCQLRTPPPVPTTSIYSRSDGIVAWETCLHASPAHHVEDIEVNGSHIGLGTLRCWKLSPIAWPKIPVNGSHLLLLADVFQAAHSRG